MSTLNPVEPADVVDAVREHPRLVPHGALTKEPLVAADPAAVRLDMTSLTGVGEYDPSEFTFTARAGTRLSEIETLLAENDQRMPFDPPLVEAGATIGGTLAGGLNGSGRLRYGGLRDFVIGVRLVDGTGQLVRGGGKVVKNAAGFDLPRLMVGSMGRLGVIVELTFKVFPAPKAWRSLRVMCRDLEDAMRCMAELAVRPFEFEAMDLEPPATLVIRLSGEDDSLTAHVRRVVETIRRPHDVLTGADETSYWLAQRAFSWVGPARRLIKVPLTPRRIPELERVAERQEVPRRYGVAGNVAWLAWPTDRPLEELDLAGQAALTVRGPPLNGASPWLGPPPVAAEAFARRVKDALDPGRRLPELV